MTQEERGIRRRGCGGRGSGRCTEGGGGGGTGGGERLRSGVVHGKHFGFGIGGGGRPGP